MTDKVPPHKILLYHKIACKKCNKDKCLKVKYKEDPVNSFGLGKAYVYCMNCKENAEFTDYYITIEERKELWESLTPKVNP